MTDEPDRAERLVTAWRTLDAPALDAADRARLRDLLSGPLALHCKGWPEAVRGIPARAVGLGVDLLAAGRVRGPAADLVFSALLVHAVDGNPAAELVLGHAVARLKGTTTIDDPPSARLYTNRR